MVGESKIPYAAVGLPHNICCSAQHLSNWITYTANANHKDVPSALGLRAGAGAVPLARQLRTKIG